MPITSNEVALLPLLSDSLYNELKCIASSTGCLISLTLTQAHDYIKRSHKGLQPSSGYPKVVTGDAVSMLTIRNKDGELELSFLPKGRTPVYTIQHKWSTENRQTGKPAKIVASILECFDRTEVWDQVKWSNKWHNYDPSTGIVAMSKKNDIEYHVFDPEILAELPVRQENSKVKRYTDKQYEEFANNLKSFYEEEIRIETITGEEILKGYDYHNYFEGKGKRGTLWESCMKAAPPEWLKLYTHSPNCSLVVGYKEGKVVARALLWNTNKGLFMDRVYHYEDYYYNKMVDHAKEQGWMYKGDNNSSYAGSIVAPNSTGVYPASGKSMELEVADIYTNLAYYPYLDTLKLITLEDSTLHNKYNSKDYDLEVEGAQGEPSGGSARVRYVYCAVSGARMHPNEVIEIPGHGTVGRDYAVMDYRGQYIPTNYMVTLASGEIATSGDVNIIQVIGGGYVFRTNAIRTRIDGRLNWYALADVYLHANGNYYLHGTGPVAPVAATPTATLQTASLEDSGGEPTITQGRASDYMYSALGPLSWRIVTDPGSLVMRQYERDWSAAREAYNAGLWSSTMPSAVDPDTDPTIQTQSAIVDAQSLGIDIDLI